MYLCTSFWAVFGVWSGRRLYCSAVKEPAARLWNSLVVVIGLDAGLISRWPQAVLQSAGRIKCSLYMSATISLRGLLSPSVLAQVS